MSGHDDGGHEVRQVALADEFCAQFDAFATSDHGESGGIAVVANVLDVVVGAGVGDGVAFHRHVVYGTVGNVGEVVVDHGKARGGQGVDQLELGALHVLDALERFEVLFAHGGDDAYLGIHQVADLLDVADLLGTHLADEYVVVGFHLLAHGTYHAHGGVEAAGGHQHVVPLAQDAVEVVLGAGLAVATGNADDGEAGHLGQYLLGLVVIFAVDLFLDGLHQPVGNHHQVGGQDGQSQQGAAAVVERGRGGSKAGNDEGQQQGGHIEAGGPAGEYQRLFVLGLQVVHALVEGDRDGDNLHEERQKVGREQQEQKQVDEPRYRGERFAFEPTVVAVVAVGVLLHHLQLEFHFGCSVEEQGQEGDDGEYLSHDFCFISGCKKFCTTALNS